MEEEKKEESWRRESCRKRWKGQVINIQSIGGKQRERKRERMRASERERQRKREIERN